MMFKDLNEVFQAKARLGIMSLLVTVGEADFSTLKSSLDLTDGNLSAHLRVLEEAGYIEVEKKFVHRKPKTVCQATAAGKDAFLRHLNRLEEIIRMVNEGEPPTHT
jgi:DNA-binding transcriptional ArsR family regulator